jgi:hypothetical protein
VQGRMETATGWRQVWTETPAGQRGRPGQEEPGVCVGAGWLGSGGRARTRVVARAVAGVGRMWSGRGRLGGRAGGLSGSGRVGR